MKRVLFAALMLVCGFAFAEVSPQRGAYDARVRIVDYNPNDVVRLTTFFGVSTHVQFGDKEKILDIATGDDQLGHDPAKWQPFIYQATRN